MRDECRGRFLFFVAAVMAATGAFAFQPIPKEGAKALGVTRGKPFSAGAVFINGKYIEPPYVVERWGTGIRINSIPVTGQVVDWNEFLKTQDGVKTVKKEAFPVQEVAPVAQQVPVAPPPAPAADVSSLDDLFDDDPKPARPTPAPRAVATPAASQPVAAPAAPRTVTTYALSGAFKPNESSKALLGRINSSRTEIDRILRSGGFVCFGDSYSRVTGDKRTLMAMLERLPELEQRSGSLDAFRAGVRSAGLVYLNEVLCEDLFRNRIDYRKLKERRERIKSDQKWSQILEDVSDPVF